MAPALGVVRPDRVARAVFAGAALVRVARGKERRPPLVASTIDEDLPASAAGSRSGGLLEAGLAGETLRGRRGGAGPAPVISVVIPARDEAERIGGALGPLAGAPGVLEVVVVDDRSEDATAAVAREAGSRVIDGEPLPGGWVGKPWALQQGLSAAQGEIVVFLDADVRPDPRLPLAVAGLLDEGSGADLASAQLAFDIPDVAQRVLHPALLATLVYRLGPLDTTMPVPASVRGINGQCFAARRTELIAAGGFGLVAGISTDDIALARALAGAGWRVVVADGSALGSVRMYKSAGEALREWAGRSLALPGASPRWRQLFDLAVVWTVQGLPGLRVWIAIGRFAVGRGAPGVQGATGTGGATGVRRESNVRLRHAARALRPFDVGALALRWSLAVAFLQVYRRDAAGADRGAADPLALFAPLVDPVAAAALTRGTLRPVRRWRGRKL